MIAPGSPPPARPQQVRGEAPAPAAPPRDFLGALLRQGASHGIAAELLLAIL